jgi:cyanate permease
MHKFLNYFIAGPPLFGWLVDATGDYLIALITATVAQGLATIFSAIATYAHCRNN